MKTRKLLCLAILCASTTLTPHLLTSGEQSQLAAMDPCPQCSMPLVAPTISLSKIFL